MVLDKIVVLECAGLAPAPFAGLIQVLKEEGVGLMLANAGADVIRIDRPNSAMDDVLAQSALHLSFMGRDTFKSLVLTADVLIEPYRPGVMEKLQLGPDVLCTLNPRLIYVRLTGFGQSGPYKHMAGHDLNYLALSGALELSKRTGEAPRFPVNLMGDFAGGSYYAVIGILLALLQRHSTNRGQVIDANIVDGTAYLTTFLHNMRALSLPIDVLQGDAPFYDVYETLDHNYITVACLEPHFYSIFLDKMGRSQDPLFQDQFNRSNWPRMKHVLTEMFRHKSLQAWTNVFHGTDACVVPVVTHPPPRATHPDVLARLRRPHTPTLLKPGTHTHEIKSRL